VSKGHSFGYHTIITNVTMNYTGERKRSEKKTYNGTAVVLEDQRSELGSATLFSASVLFKDIWKGFEIQLSGYNIFDEKWKMPDSEGKVENDLPMWGSSFLATVAYDF
jgi:hypothetical protein